jgi:uncharacterized membrane protein
MKRIFTTGLAVVVPILVTVYVLVALFTFADGIMGKVINKYLEQYLGYTIPGIGIILFLILIFLIGALIRISRMRLRKYVEGVFFKVPVVNKVYAPVKKIFDFLFFPDLDKKFKSTVLVEYPRKGIYSIGFLTNESFSAIKEKTGKKMYNVYFPFTPSPITGYTVIVPEEDITFLDMSVEQAMKMVISGGLMNPDGK